jgi:hypothetical protein
MEANCDANEKKTPHPGRMEKVGWSSANHWLRLQTAYDSEKTDAAYIRIWLDVDCQS